MVNENTWKAVIRYQIRFFVSWRLLSLRRITHLVRHAHSKNEGEKETNQFVEMGTVWPSTWAPW